MAFFERVRGENFAIFQGNESKENVETSGVHHGKQSHLSARAPLQDRSMCVLNGPKMQPNPCVKQQGLMGVENCSAKYHGQKGAQVSYTSQANHHPTSFSIFEDDCKDMSSHTNVGVSVSKDNDEHEEMDLHPAVTAFFKPNVAQATDLCLDESMKGDSLMSFCTPEEEMTDATPVESATKEADEKQKADEHLWFPEYQHEIYQYLREAELRLGIRPDYMRKQSEITYNMRSILVDWMVEVAEEYKLERETLCLAISFVDRFLSVMAVARNKLQLVGTAAMFIAAKYEEIYPPDVGEFVYITDNSYTKKQVLQMERLILRTLSFNVASPTINCFCSNLLANLETDEKTSSLAMYLLELSMLDGEKFLKFPPSLIATSCVCLAHHTMGHKDFMQRVSDLTGYQFHDLNACVTELYNVFSGAASLQHPAIREKYSKDKWHRVSEINPASSFEGSSAPVSFS